MKKLFFWPLDAFTAVPGYVFSEGSGIWKEVDDTVIVSEEK